MVLKEDVGFRLRAGFESQLGLEQKLLDLPGLQLHGGVTHAVTEGVTWFMALVSPS